MANTKITYEELNEPSVDNVLARQAEESAGRAGADVERTGKQVASIIHKSWFNLMIAGAVGAFAAWAIIEPYFDDINVDASSTALALLFPAVAALAGMMIGGMEGFLARNYTRAAIGAAVGIGVGFIGGCIALIIASFIFNVVGTIIFNIVGQKALMDPAHSLSGFMALMIMRSLAWAVAGMAVGLGPGIALKSKKLVLNGFLGGMIGGLIGGLLFDPVNYLVSGGTLLTGAEVSRAIGLTIIGASAGVMIGLVEMMTRDAWLIMTAGPLKGKQFTIYREPTIIGSSPRCEVYLFKDPSIEPFHAAVHIIRDGFEIEDRSSSAGVFVNGSRVTRRRLHEGDNIRIGDIEFLYLEREKSGKSA